MRTLSLLLTAALLPSCFGGGGDTPLFIPQPKPVPVAPGNLALGDPLPGLSQSELAAFFNGKLLFSKRFSPEEGLGPLYNASSCVSCHSRPVPGGSAPLYRNFFVAAKQVGATQELLDGLPSVVIPSFGSGPHETATFTLEGGRREIPASEGGFNVVSAQRNSIPIFGTGLFEFVSDDTIIANSDPDDLNGDGISGRFNTDPAAQSSIGRFGMKAQANAVEFFTRGPLQNQMGITSEPFQGNGAIVSLCTMLRPQGGSGSTDGLTDADGVPDPEILRQDLGDLIAFSRFLAPPQPRPFTDRAREGEALFETIGCADCHIPELPSSRGPVRAYTDLLLHDMGPALADGIHMGAPQASTIDGPLTTDEFRTQPLWGVSGTGPFLHDGRAETLREAIEAHGGEATDAHDDFLALTAAEQQAIIAFLKHL